MGASEPRLKDPLSEPARRERRSLLGFSILGLLISLTGAIPKSIPALGITTDNFNEIVLIYILILVLIYFLIAFILYGISDCLNYLHILGIQTKDDLDEMSRKEVKRLQTTGAVFDPQRQALPPRESYEALENIRDQQVQAIKYLQQLNVWINPISKIRVLFEFILPLVVGVFSITNLIVLAISMQ